jgi:hypothetical protein
MYARVHLQMAYEDPVRGLGSIPGLLQPHMTE